MALPQRAGADRDAGQSAGFTGQSGGVRTDAAEVNRAAEQLLEIAGQRIAAQKREIPFGSDRQRNLFLRMLSEREAELIHNAMFGHAAGREEQSPLTRPQPLGYDRQGARSSQPETQEPIYFEREAEPDANLEYSVARALKDFGYADALGIDLESNYIQSYLEEKQAEFDDAHHQDKTEPVSIDDMRIFADSIYTDLSQSVGALTKGEVFNMLDDSMGSQLVAAALELVGTNYDEKVPLSDENNSSKRIDCSGLVSWALHQVAPEIENDFGSAARYQIDDGTAIWPEEHHGDLNLDNFQPGDLLYWENAGGEIVHTGIYIGNGYMIDQGGTVCVQAVKPHRQWRGERSTLVQINRVVE